MPLLNYTTTVDAAKTVGEIQRHLAGHGARGVMGRSDPMGWRIVRQPNGLLARFGDVVDDFTHYDLTEAEALALCRDLGETDAGSQHRVGCGTGDLPVLRIRLAGFGVEARAWRHEARRDGLDRWRDCLMTIEAIHGADVARDREAEFSQIRDGEG